MKKNICILLILSCLMLPVIAQTFTNPADEFYDDMNRWEILGYIDDVPQVKPYAVPFIKYALEQVIERGSDTDAERAKYYLSKVLDSPFNISLKADADVSKGKDGIDNGEAGTVIFTGSMDLFSSLYMTYDFGVTGTLGDFKLPQYRTLSFDMADDPTRVGPIKVNLNFNNILSYGTEEFGLVAGISRSEYGQYPDNSIVFDSSTFHTPYINVYIQKPNWNYTQVLYSLSATDNFGRSHFSGKFLSLHDVTLNFLPELSFSYYETVVYGGRFDYTYLLPCPYMVSQAFGDFGDNLQMGVAVVYKPVKGLKLTADLYVDDLSANDVVKFNFDTKMIFAAQLTAQYVPFDSLFTRIYAETLLLAPRMYAHSDVSLSRDGTYNYASGRYVNYQNYTHNGDCIATKIWPNSIACSLGTEMEPVDSLKLHLSALFVCHANVNETIETEQAKKYLEASAENANCATDGSVLNFPGFPNESIHPAYANINNYPASYAAHFPFLEQPTKQYTFQLDTGISYAFKLTDAISCEVSLTNVFEYIMNDGVQNVIFTPGGLGVRNATDADVQNALDTWRTAIVKSTVNDYLTLSAKINF